MNAAAETVNSNAVEVGLKHIDAWSHHDWAATRAMLAENVHALVTTTSPGFGDSSSPAGSSFTGLDAYMERKIKGAQLVQPGSVRISAAAGDETSALILLTMDMNLPPHGTTVHVARACLFALDEHNKIKDERDEFFVLSQGAAV